MCRVRTERGKAKKGTGDGFEVSTASVDARNAAGLALLIEFGSEVTGTAEGTFLLQGELVDSVYLALMRRGRG